MSIPFSVSAPIFLQAEGEGGGFSSLILMFGVVVILYFFMIRPQAQRQKKEKRFREALKKGDRVVTVGGIHGVIASIEDTTMLLNIDQGVKIRVDKQGIQASSIAESSDKKPESTAEKKA